MRFEHLKTRVHREDESIAPFPRRHLPGLTRVLGRQFVVKRDDHRLFAGKVAIQEPDTDACLLRDLPKCRRFIAAGGDQLHRCAIEVIPRRGTLGALARWTAAFSLLDIFSEHVH